MEREKVLKIGFSGLFSGVWCAYFLSGMYLLFHKTLQEITMQLGGLPEPMPEGLWLPGLFGLFLGIVVGGLVGAEKSGTAFLSIIPLSVLGYYLVLKMLTIFVIGLLAVILAWGARLVFEKVVED